MTDRRTVLLGLAATSIAAPAWAKGGTRLFNGKDLSGWVPLGDANWTVTGGVLTADKASATSFLLSERDYADFELRVEFWVSADANSGVFLRCSNRAEITADNAYEVNIFDTRPDPTYGTGAIVGVAKVSPMPKAGGRWNTMAMVARGDAFSVTLNGQKTVDGARDGKHRKGPVGLQYGAGTVKFRKVELREI